MIVKLPYSNSVKAKAPRLSRLNASFGIKLRVNSVGGMDVGRWPTRRCVVINKADAGTLRDSNVIWLKTTAYHAYGDSLGWAGRWGASGLLS